MVCAKCQKSLKSTTLATPGVKRKNEIYYGSPASDKGKSSATTSFSGVGKSKLLTKSAKNPYAAYSSSCEKCKMRTEIGRKFCQRCAYKNNVCPMCGKSLAGEKAQGDQPFVQGQKFSAK